MAKKKRQELPNPSPLSRLDVSAIAGFDTEGGGNLTARLFGEKVLVDVFGKAGPRACVAVDVHRFAAWSEAITGAYYGRR